MIILVLRFSSSTVEESILLRPRHPLKMNYSPSKCQKPLNQCHSIISCMSGFPKWDDYEKSSHYVKGKWTWFHFNHGFYLRTWFMEETLYDSFNDLTTWMNILNTEMLDIQIQWHEMREVRQKLSQQSCALKSSRGIGQIKGEIKKTVWMTETVSEMLVFISTLLWMTAEYNFSELCFVAVILISLPEHSAQNEP